MKIIVSIAEKGGVGKTSIACIAAAGLAKSGARTLLIGLDVQGSSAGVYLPSLPAVSGSAALLLGQSPKPTKGHLGVHVLAGGAALDGADVRALHPDELRFQLEKLGAEYDAVVVDVAPVLLHLHSLARDAADLAFVVTDAQSTESIAGLGKVMREIQVAQERGRHAPKLTVPIVNRVNRRAALDCELADAVIAKFGQRHPVLEVAHTTVISSSIAKKRPELALTEDSPAKKALAQLVAYATEGLNASREATHG